MRIRRRSGSGTGAADSEDCRIGDGTQPVARMSLGYRDDEAPYPIKLHSVSLGKAAHLGAPDLATLEKKMAEAADKTPHIICHELLVTSDDEFIMVFMTHAG